MSEVVIIGGGAAGMAAAVFAGRNGAKVRLFEKNEKLGKKLFITGKGRCNFTNACDMEELFQNVVTNPKFLYSAFYSFTNQDAIGFFEELGVETKVERGNRAFPSSDHSSDIIRALQQEMRRLGVQIRLHTTVKSLLTKENQVTGIILEDGETIAADAVILAAGGASYPVTGSDGAGVRMASKVGIPVKESAAALVPLVVSEDYIPLMQGLSLRNVALKIMDQRRVIFDEFGEMMFTHFGITGPLVLSASSRITRKLEKQNLKAFIDLKPALTEEQLDARVLREFEQGKNRQFKNVIPALFPARMLSVMLALSAIPYDKKVNEITREERQAFVKLIKSFPMTITKTRGLDEAIITQGGIDTKAVNPSTMESRQYEHLYFIGEVLDVDALTGGFNLQIAWSTAFLAATAIQEQTQKDGGMNIEL
ncbi:MAG: NAD(P)/FAD-dependent oxidoreductase [Lachnospiraceae bacterium]|nr:NAD(P)/FAD-dependent oxidoreductase [Lachnospiraceae bacterium]